MPDAPILRIPYVHLDHEGTVLSTGTMPPTISRESLAGAGRQEVTETIYALLQQPGRWSLADGEPRLLPPLETDARRTALGQRARLLSACDWTQMPDVPGGVIWQSAWRNYRQQLRDITGQDGFPLSVIWPAPPADTPDGEPAAPAVASPAPVQPPHPPYQAS